MNILVTGASGYIGGRLIPRLGAMGHHVTCLVRHPEKLKTPGWENVDIRQADLLNLDSLRSSMEAADIAYYLVHSMADGVSGYIERDHAAAANFATAARERGVRRIIYLGGLGESDKYISSHLQARQHVGEILRQSGLPVTEFRAAIIIGSGSMSFEMIRYLAERLPLLFTPAWIDTLCQPIAIENILDYLIQSLTEPRSNGAIFEIGGPDVLTYSQIMRQYAQERGLHRPQLKLPFLTTRLLALGADIVTPLPSPYLRILIEGLRSEVVVRDQSASQVFKLDLIPFRQSVKNALERHESGEVGTYWNGDGSRLLPGNMHRIIEGMFVEQQRLATVASPAALYKSFSTLGGERGWYYANWLWALRGALDQLVGGVGSRRSQRTPSDLQVGDVLGPYRVEKITPGSFMRLRSELKSPGPAWMQFEALPAKNGGSLYIQTAFFEPHGLAGLTYWYFLYPFHQLIFNGLARQVTRQAEAAHNLSAIPST